MSTNEHYRCSITQVVEYQRWVRLFAQDVTRVFIATQSGEAWMSQVPIGVHS